MIYDFEIDPFMKFVDLDLWVFKRGYIYIYTYIHGSVRKIRGQTFRNDEKKECQKDEKKDEKRRKKTKNSGFLTNPEKCRKKHR